MITKKESDEKINEGWIRTWMIFEVLAINEQISKESLESLIGKLENDPRAKVYSKNFGEFRRVVKPIEGVDEGYSITCEVELISKKLDNLIQIVTEYGPSATELLEPTKLKVDVSEVQTILNNISSLVHQYAQAGAGGIVFIKEQKEAEQE